MILFSGDDPSVNNDLFITCRIQDDTMEQVTSLPTTTTTKVAPFPEVIAAARVEQIGGGIALWAGLIGNTLSILVLRRQRLRYNNISLYLTVLAWSDLAMLVFGQGARHWIRAITGYDPPRNSKWYCQFWQILSVASAYSNYILAGVSFERCIAIKLPLKARRILSRKSAKIYLGVSLICLILYRIHAFWTFKISYKNGQPGCGIDPSNYFAREVRPWYDLVFKWLVPAIIIVISNIFIIHSLYHAKTKREEVLSAEAGGQGNKDNKMGSLVIMLVVVSITFVIMVSPVHLNYVVSSAFDTSYTTKERGAAIQRLTFACGVTSVYLNHAINFFLYVISGGDFRDELKAMLLEWFPCCKANKQPSQEKNLTSGGKTISSITEKA